MLNNKIKILKKNKQNLKRVKMKLKIYNKMKKLKKKIFKKILLKIIQMSNKYKYKKNKQ